MLGSTRSSGDCAGELLVYEQLMADVESMSFLAVGRKDGVSDNAVRKWIRWYEYKAERERADGGDRRDPDEEAA